MQWKNILIVIQGNLFRIPDGLLQNRVLNSDGDGLIKEL